MKWSVLQSGPRRRSKTARSRGCRQIDGPLGRTAAASVRNGIALKMGNASLFGGGGVVVNVQDVNGRMAGLCRKVGVPDRGRVGSVAATFSKTKWSTTKS